MKYTRLHCDQTMLVLFINTIYSSTIPLTVMMKTSRIKPNYFLITVWVLYLLIFLENFKILTTVRRYHAKREELALTKSMALLVCVRTDIQG